MTQPTTERDRPRVEDWRAHQMRITAFASDVEAFHPDSEWTAITNERPEQHVEQPRDMQSRAEGPWHSDTIANGRFIVRRTLSRIDWLIGIASTSNEGPPPDLGSFPQVIHEFVDRVSPRLSDRDLQIRRLALGAILHLPSETIAQANSILTQYVPFDVPENATDLIFRINRPTVSRVLEDGTAINRLANWTVVRIDTVLISLSGQGTPIQPEGPPPEIACQLELDINTDAERTQSLPPERLQDLLREFTEFAIERVRTGEPQ